MVATAATLWRQRDSSRALDRRKLRVPVSVTATVSSSLMKPRRGCCSVVSTESTMRDSSGRRIFGLIGIARSVREPRRFMTHQADAVYKEVEVIGISGFVHHLQPGLVNLGPDRTGLNSPHGSTLCRLDLGQHVFELGIRFALNGHAANITDIAVVIPTGINRHDFPVLPLLRRWGAIELWPAVIKQYSKTRPRLVSSRRSASTISCLVTPGPCPSITASMLSTTVSVASRSFRNSSGVLRARSTLQH